MTKYQLDQINILIEARARLSEFRAEYTSPNPLIENELLDKIAEAKKNLKDSINE